MSFTLESWIYVTTNFCATLLTKKERIINRKYEIVENSIGRVLEFSQKAHTHTRLYIHIY